jgi:fructose/tagatose bisphosphate aldolase
MCAKVNTAEIGAMVRETAFGPAKTENQRRIHELARDSGVFAASIQALYEAIGRGSHRGFTVPAMNLRGLTYDAARAAFRAAIGGKVGAFIFEIARSEMGYTLQSPAEYAAMVLAAAVAEGFKGPVFLQADHTQVARKNFAADAAKELDSIKTLIKEAIGAGFYNIDIDASTLVDIQKKDLLEQQDVNSRITAELTAYIRSIEAGGVTVSVGGEIGEIGAGNSTEGDLRAFMTRYRHYLSAQVKGISKISVQTGTTHGGIALPDGTIARVELDFDTLEKLSRISREEYGLGGAVQHGASTLPDEMFDIFPGRGTLEVHLATGFQNIIFDSPHFPQPLREKINAGLAIKYASDRKSDETGAQFTYRNRKRAFGDFKQEIWNIPADNLRKIGRELEDRFSLLYHKLNVLNTEDIVARVIKKS